MVWLPLDIQLTPRHGAAIKPAIFVRMQRIVRGRLSFRRKAIEIASKAERSGRGRLLSSALCRRPFGRSSSSIFIL
jgi:hypothetical protein